MFSSYFQPYKTSSAKEWPYLVPIDGVIILDGVYFSYRHCNGISDHSDGKWCSQHLRKQTHRWNRWRQKPSEFLNEKCCENLTIMLFPHLTKCSINPATSQKWKDLVQEGKRYVRCISGSTCFYRFQSEVGAISLADSFVPYLRAYRCCLIYALTRKACHYWFIYLFIYLFIFGCVGFFSFLCAGFLQLWRAGPLFIAVRGLLTAVVSPVAEHRLQTRRLSSCAPRAQLLRGMRDPPRPGLEPVSPALAGRLSTTAPPGKPHYWFFNTIQSHAVPFHTLVFLLTRFHLKGLWI